jgi:hypothetical protein
MPITFSGHHGDQESLPYNITTKDRRVDIRFGALTRRDRLHCAALIFQGAVRRPSGRVGAGPLNSE